MALITINFSIFLIIAIFTNQINAQKLTAVKSKNNLTTPRGYLSSLYGAGDKIHIFGGWNGTSLSDFFTYTLSTDTIEIVDTGYQEYGGEMVRDGQGEIYYCGGVNVKAIMKYNQINKTWLEVAPLPRKTYFFDLLQLSENTALIVGGNRNSEIVLFNMTDLSANIVGTIPELRVAYSTVAALYNEDEAIVFHIPYSGYTSVFKYSLSTQSFTLLSESFPLLYFSSLVYDGSHVYIVNGGYLNTELYGGMIQVDPSTANWTFIPVNNFPSPDANFWGTSSVYVQKLNRIYIFGGYSSEAGDLDGIWWVDLDPLNSVTSAVTTTTTPPTTTPTTIESPLFDCSNKPDGKYPHPINCTMFFECHFGDLIAYECPEQLLFDPIHLTCNASVKSDINCSEMSDGVHPHTRDCSLFLVCQFGLVSVYSCPEDLLFDPIDLKCNFPELVVCDV